MFRKHVRLRINFHENKVLVVGATEEEQYRIAHMLNCKRGAFPFTYMGLPISDRAFTVGDWGPLTRKVAK